MDILNRASLLAVVGIAEGATGLGLILAPTALCNLLLGSDEISQETIVCARLAGAALICIGNASWSSKGDNHSIAQRGLLVGLSIYNGLGATIFAYAGLVLQLSGVLLWPAFIVHALLAAWCLVCLREPTESRSTAR